MKKILLITYNYAPMNNGATQRLKGFTKYLPLGNFDITVLTTNIEGKVSNEKNVIRLDNQFEKYHINCKNLIIRRIYNCIIIFLMIIGLINDWNFSWENNAKCFLDKYLVNHKFDLILASFPPLPSLTVALYASKKFNIPLVVDYRDGLLYSPFRWVTNKGLIYYNKCKKIEGDCANRAILQISVTPQIVDYFNLNYKKHTILVPNGFDIEEIINEKSLKLPNGFNVLFTGSINKGGEIYNKSKFNNFLHNLFIRNPDVNFVFLGVFYDYELTFFKKHNNVFVYNKVSRDVSIATQRNTDIILLFTNDNPNSTHGKLYEYLFSHKPIINIGGLNTNAARIIKETNSGKTFSYDEIDDATEFINNIKKNKFCFKQIGLENYTRKKQILYMANEINRIL